MDYSYRNTDGNTLAKKKEKINAEEVESVGEDCPATPPKFLPTEITVESPTEITVQNSTENSPGK